MDAGFAVGELVDHWLAGDPGSEDAGKAAPCTIGAVDAGLTCATFSGALPLALSDASSAGAVPSSPTIKSCFHCLYAIDIAPVGLGACSAVMSLLV